MKFGRRARTIGTGQGGHDRAATSGVSHIVLVQAGPDNAVQAGGCHALRRLATVLTIIVMILIIGQNLGTATSQNRRHRVGILIVMTLALVACSDGASSDTGPGLQIVATTTILGDVARNVAGEAASVEVLMPVGADPHDFQASAQQLAAVQGADLVIVNGLGLEEGLLDALEAARADGANILEVAPLLDPIPFGTQGTSDDEDPHVWMDPIRMADATRFIATELLALDPGGDWLARADTYATELISTDEEIATVLGAVAVGERQIVTNHDSLGYFAPRYGFDIVGVVIPGGSTLGDPSSAELAQLVDVIETEGVKAVFVETTQPSALADAIAGEAGHNVEVVELHTGSLGEAGSGADTLVTMLETNARRIAGALS